MIVSARLLAPTDVEWLIDRVSCEGETVTLVARYSMNPRRNQRQDTVTEAARAEALWRGCRVHVNGGGRRRRVPIGRRCDLVVHIEPRRDDFGEGAMIPVRPSPSGPARAQRRPLPPHS
ncbi:MAG: hypothetical protein OEZ14_17490 [Acidimicrobiia bacterium]|nr:hypothetical protein [Acidimicrobiia bacterium]